MDEATIQAWAPSPEVFDAGSALVRTGALQQCARTPDASVIFGACAGSGKTPYTVSARLSAPEAPVCRCTCPSRLRPCKHAIALLVAYARAGAGFIETEAPADLLDSLKPPKVAGPKKVKTSAPVPNKAAQAKKITAQLEGLQSTERVLADLATLGLAACGPERSSALAERAKEIADFHLPGVALAIRRLGLVLEAEDDVSQRSARAARLMAQLWSMVTKGRAVLEATPDESVSETDAVVEELLGKVWQLTELKEKGFVRTDLRAIELAYQRIDDPARDERVETSFLFDLTSFEVHRDVQYTPQKRIGKQAAKASFAGMLTLLEAAIYPGFLNRRIRWEASALSETAAPPDAFRAMLTHALPVSDALGKLKAQRKQLLAPDSATLLVQLAQLRLGDEHGFIEDPAGARLPFSSDAVSRRALSTLRMSEQPTGAAAMLVQLITDDRTNQVLAQPMTLVSPAGALRLSL